MSDARLRAVLLERLHTIGVAPDSNNDRAAVEAACARLGISRSVVVQELVQMRMERAQAMVKRMRIQVPAAGMLTMMAASRDSLLDPRLSYEEAWRRRANDNVQDLMEDLAEQLGADLQRTASRPAVESLA